MSNLSSVQIFSTHGNVIFEHSAIGNSLALTVSEAVASGVSLSNANLSGANISNACLAGGNFEYADLAQANMTAANCRNANFRGASLLQARFDGADLSGADLSQAIACAGFFERTVMTDANLEAAQLLSCQMTNAALKNANLTKASLHDSDCTGANLSGAVITDLTLSATLLPGAYLGDVDLRDADLTPIRDDFFALLSCAPGAVPYLIEMLKEGAVHAYTMTADDKFGMLAKILMGNPVSDTARFFRQDVSRYAELFAVGMFGADPASSQVTAILVEWAQTWLGRIRTGLQITQFDSSINAEGGKLH